VEYVENLGLVKNTEKSNRASIEERERESVCAMTIPHLCGMDQNGSTSNNFNLLSRQRQLDKNEKYNTNMLIGTWRICCLTASILCRS
jgi:hypothetical protein